LSGKFRSIAQRFKAPAIGRSQAGQAASLLRGIEPLMKEEREDDMAQTHLEKGDAFFAAEQYEEAAAEYAKAIGFGDSNVNTLNSWGVALERLKKYDEAIEKYKQATAADPNHANAFNNWGDALYNQEKYDEAIEKYKQATLADPNHAGAFNNWGNALYNQKKYDEAIEKYKQATAADPNYADAFNNWGDALYNQKKYDEEIEKYKQATLANPNYADAFNNWGNALYNQKKYDEAIEKYKQATAADLNHAGALFGWGNALYGQKKYDEAIEKYKQATAADPNHAGALFGWGLALDALKRHSEVIDKYGQAIKADQKSTSAVYAAHNIAAFLERQGKYKQSFAAWETARQAYEGHIHIAKESGDADFFQNYGGILRNALGKLTEAEKIYRDGLAYEADHVGILIGLLNVYLEKIEDQDEESAKKGIMRRFWPFAITDVSEAQAEPANYWKAREVYFKAESILKKRCSETAKDVNVSIQLSELYLKIEDFAAAELILLEAMNEDREFPQTYANLGVLYSRRGDYTRAVQHFEQALQKDVDDLTVRTNLAEACRKAKLVERSDKGSQAGVSRRSRGIPAFKREDFPAPDEPRITKGLRSRSARTLRNSSKT
jgi:tetratricopeptide (TPR) repeat protein